MCWSPPLPPDSDRPCPGPDSSKQTKPKRGLERVYRVSVVRLASRGIGLQEVVKEESFDAFYRCEFPQALALAYVLGGSWPIAEDIAQEAMLRAFQRWTTISRYDRPGAWVRRVTINLVRSRGRRAVAEAKALMLVAGQRSALPRLAEDDEAFWAALRSRPRRQREVLALYYLEDRPVADVASILGVAEGTVKTHLHNGREALREQLS